VLADPKGVKNSQVISHFVLLGSARIKAACKHYCINVCLVRSCSVSINSCKSESVKLSREATLKVTNSQNSCTGWANACIKHQEK